MKRQFASSSSKQIHPLIDFHSIIITHITSLVSILFAFWWRVYLSDEEGGDQTPPAWQETRPGTV